MHIKPANVAINAANDNEAVLIEIGVGYTNELSAPEIRQVIDSLGLSFETRRLCDSWALGLLFIYIARFGGNDDSFGMRLQRIGRELTHVEPECRPGLAEGTQQLDS